MRKTLFSMILVVVLVMGVGVVSFAAPSKETLKCDFQVINPFLEWLDPESFSFLVDATKSLDDFYPQEAHFNVHSTTSYDIELKLKGIRGKFETIVMNKVGETWENMFDAELAGWMSGQWGSGYENVPGFSRPVDYNTLAHYGNNWREHTLNLRLVLVDEVNSNKTRRVKQLPNGTYYGKLIVTVTEKL